MKPFKLIVTTILATSAIAMAEEGEKKMITAQDVIAKLNLQPLQDEGGYYRETYRSQMALPAPTYGIDGNGDRAVATAIYYLLAPGSFSALHRLKSDEVFHFYAGDPVEMIQIDPNGTLRRFTMGSDIFAGHVPQVVVPAGAWQALRLRSGGAWALLGTTVSPGFEFEDFELGDQEKMVQQFPQLRTDILRFSRGRNESAH